jgi:Protein of unknown function (DUF2585)
MIDLAGPSVRHHPLRIYVLIGLALIACQGAVLYAMGRVPMCTCGTIKLWYGNAQSSENSQHIFDWYSFSHVLHGFIFYWLFRWLLPRAPVGLWLVLAIAFENFWEIIENSNYTIERFRAGTISLNYYGDSIVNSVADNISMIAGFTLAHRIPLWTAVMLALIVELVLAYWIRDNLTLNVIMLLHPFDSIKHWQSGAALH